MNLFKQLMSKARRSSPWIYLVNTGSCNGCDIEVMTCMTPRYDAEQLGIRREGSPKHADILLITGPLTLRTHDALLAIYSQIPHPKVVVAIGSCPKTGSVFAGSPTVLNGVVGTIPVDLFVPGCPPRPQAVIQGIAKAADLLANMTLAVEEGCDE